MAVCLSRRIGMCLGWWLVVVVVLLQSLEGLTSASDVYSTLRLRKCHCNNFQAWDGAKCIHNVTTFLPIYHNTFDAKTQDHGLDIERSSLAHLTSMFENVTIQDLQCSGNLKKRNLNEREILLLPDSRLLWLSANIALPLEYYCIVHFWEDGHAYFRANVCSPPPPVPRCCPVDHLLGRDGSCYPSENLQAPPIKIGGIEEDWNSMDGDMVHLKCKNHEYHHYVHLGRGEGTLADTRPMAKLQWSPPVWTASIPWATKYCVALQEDAGDLQYVAQICLKDYTRYHEKQCGGAACVHKCCREDEILYGTMCVEAFSNETWHPSRIPNQTINEEWKIVTGEPGCSFHLHQDSLHLLPNGSLQAGPADPIPPSEYCLDSLLDDAGNIENVAFLCFQQIDTTCLWRDILMKVVLGVSCVFLTATLLVYLGVTEIRDSNSMYSRCLISLVAAMLTAYISHMIDADDLSTVGGCTAKAFIGHLSGLAMFFWLNVMCFDMWKILGGMTRRHYSKKVFLGYSLYAWGCPLVISLVALVLDVVHPEGDLILPNYYHGSCWFNGNAAYWLYFSGFILVLVVINIGFFIHVAITLSREIKQKSQTFSSESSHTSKTTKTRQNVWLFLRLFLVMGVLWITDALSAITNRKTCSYWVATDVLNGLQGVFIFILTVCSKDKLKKIKAVWGPRLKVVRNTLPSLTSRRPTQTNVLSTSDEESRKTSVTSLPRKISQASNILFSSKKSATLNPPPDAASYQGGRKGSNVSVKDIIPMSTMQEEGKAGE